MGSRYLITGAQIVLLGQVGDKVRLKLLEKIVENQFVFDSEDEISVDVEYTSAAVMRG